MNAADGSKITSNLPTQSRRLLELYQKKRRYNLKTYTFKTITILLSEKARYWNVYKCSLSWFLIVVID